VHNSYSMIFARPRLSTAKQQLEQNKVNLFKHAILSVQFVRK
jgi:hypothetical protein